VPEEPPNATAGDAAAAKATYIYGCIQNTASIQLTRKIMAL